MLYAKINPKAKFVKQNNPFTTPVEVEAEYFTALARIYEPNSPKTSFEVIFGNDNNVDVEQFLDGTKSSRFDRVSTYIVELTAEELTSWGTDDSEMLVAVAKKLGTNIVEFVDL